MTSHLSKKKKIIFIAQTLQHIIFIFALYKLNVSRYFRRNECSYFNISSYHHYIYTYNLYLNCFLKWEDCKFISSSINITRYYQN